MTRGKSRNVRGPLVNLDEEVVLNDEVNLDQEEIVAELISEDNSETEELQEFEEPQVIQVEEFNKTKKIRSFNLKNKYLVWTLKSVIGLYIIGILLGLNEVLLSKFAPVFNVIHSSTFMSGKFVPWANFVFGPVRFMINLISWFVPIILISAMLIYILSKIKWVSKKELKIFSYVLVIIILLVV